ncbi:MAG: hypothetical protein AAF415_06545 [Pseudomonadota bacterium]
MKRSRIFSAAVVMAGLAAPAVAQVTIPYNVAQTCTLDTFEFKGWFGGTAPVKGAAANPRDSEAFPTDNTVCDFYKWGAQMFLWLTSPEGSGIVLDGPGVFTVNTADWTLIPDSDGPTQMTLRSEKSDDIGDIGQTDSNAGVLMSQAGSLVYYGVHVNDVYGYFLTGQKCAPGDGGASCPAGGASSPYIQAEVFPINSGDLTAVESFAKDHMGVSSIPDADALAMELKTSWVDAATLSNPTDYVTVEATVPAFTKISSTEWRPNGTEQKTLALVGIHIVGTVQNHPEFVWATFEHVNNAPMAPYYYKGGNFIPTAFDSGGDYIFFPKGGALEGANPECMGAKDGGIAALLDGSGNPVCEGGIVASPTVRMFPWGSPSATQTSAVQANNALLMSLNQSIWALMPEGDPRAKYFQLGSVWTSPNPATADAPIPQQGMFSYYAMRGSLALSNATMETYTQGSVCFDCHQLPSDATNSFGAGQLSHIFSRIRPLAIPTP